MWALGIELEYGLGATRFSIFITYGCAILVLEATDSMISICCDRRPVVMLLQGFQYLDVQVEGLKDNDQLEYIGQQIILDGRNDPVHPRSGTYLSLNTYQAGQWIGGEYSYWKGQAELRYFYPIINLGSVRLPGSNRTIRQWRFKRGKQPLLVDGVLS